jgi:hypothetical protein
MTESELFKHPLRCVYETRDEFRIEFEDGSSATLQLADPGASVAVRGKNDAVEYLGGRFPHSSKKVRYPRVASYAMKNVLILTNGAL